jgi:hypothetical protein
MRKIYVSKNILENAFGLAELRENWFFRHENRKLSAVTGNFLQIGHTEY